MILNYINVFRGIAILLIVAGHSLHMHNLYKNIDPDISVLLTALLQNGTVLFVFIAGFLFQYLSRKYEFKDYMRKKFANVIMPYLIISSPAIIMKVLKTGASESLTGKIWIAFKFIITGSHLLPLWFVPMIFLFYLISPLLIKLDKDERIYGYLPLFIFISMIIPRENEDIPRSFIHFFSCYLFGMFASRYRERIIKVLHNRVTPLFALFLFLLFYDTYQNIDMPVYFKVPSLNYLGKMILSILLVTYLEKKDETIRQSKRNAVYNFFATYSFGIFFIHYYGVSLLNNLLIRFLGEIKLSSPVLLAGYIIFFAAVTALSCLLLLAIIKILKLAGIKNTRFFIGS